MMNTLKQELDGTRAYLETDTDAMSVVNAHLKDLPVKFSVCVSKGQDKLSQILPDIFAPTYGEFLAGR